MGDDNTLSDKFLVVESKQEGESIALTEWKIVPRYVVSLSVKALNSDFVYFSTPDQSSLWVLLMNV